MSSQCWLPGRTGREHELGRITTNGQHLPTPSFASSALGSMLGPRNVCPARFAFARLRPRAPSAASSSRPTPTSLRCLAQRHALRTKAAGAAPAAASTQETPPTLGQAAWSTTLKLACAAPVALFLLYHVVSLAQVQGGSMRPTFNAEVTHANQKHMGDIVVLNKWTPGMRRYTVGDIVTLTDPDRSDLELTKRILALEGDVVAVRGAGSHSDQRILAAVQDWEEKGGKRTAYICVPPGHAWVEGDASLMDFDKAGPAVHDQSRDSRSFGPVSPQSRRALIGAYESQLTSG